MAVDKTPKQTLFKYPITVGWCIVRRRTDSSISSSSPPAEPGVQISRAAFESPAKRREMARSNRAARVAQKQRSRTPHSR